MPSSPQSSTPAPRAPCRLAPLTSTPPSSATPTAASNSLDSHSTARKHLHRLLHLRSPLSSLLSSSPLSPIENLPSVLVMSPTLYKTPVKVGVKEGILVMDGVLVSDSDSGRRGRRSSSSDRPGHCSLLLSANNGGGNSLYKTEICRLREESRFCRYGSKCQKFIELLRRGTERDQDLAIECLRVALALSP